MQSGKNSVRDLAAWASFQLGRKDWWKTDMKEIAVGMFSRNDLRVSGVALNAN